MGSHRGMQARDWLDVCAIVGGLGLGGIGVTRWRRERRRQAAAGGIVADAGVPARSVGFLAMTAAGGALLAFGLAWAAMGFARAWRRDLGDAPLAFQAFAAATIADILALATAGGGVQMRMKTLLGDKLVPGEWPDVYGGWAAIPTMLFVWSGRYRSYEDAWLRRWVLIARSASGGFVVLMALLLGAIRLAPQGPQ